LSRNDLVLTRMGLRWRGRRIPCVIGRGGVVADKTEGDGGTPAQGFRVTGMLYRADRITRPARSARPIGPRDLWSDDPADPRYNRQVQAPQPHSHERLRRGDRLYDLVLVTDWNSSGRPGAGSAIFLHRWRRPGAPTAGCVAMAPRHLRWIAARVVPGTRLVVRRADGRR
jgi:L,D-peptidoglycan transpeptidase YkuD (ErfK/YbiS/YcfS/YnhG family)